MSKKTRVRVCAFPGCGQKFMISKRRRNQRYCMTHTPKSHVNLRNINPDLPGETYEVGR